MKALGTYIKARTDNIKPSLVEFFNINNIRLPGLLYEPSKKTKKVLINLHGNGSASVFYNVKMSNIFGKHLNKAGISYFTFNNIGAHYIKKLDAIIDGKEKEIKYGAAYELIKDCIHDIDGAINFLKKKGYKTFFLMGLSTGANKICVYNYYKPRNVFSRFILLGGGDDTGVLYQMMGQKTFKLALKKCQEAIKDGKGRNLIPKYLMPYTISYQSLFDTINPEGDYNVFPFYESISKHKLSKKQLFRELKSIQKPTYIIYGQNDEYCYNGTDVCVETLKKNLKGKRNFSFKIINDAEHNFKNKEEQLIKTVVTWIR